MNKTVETLQHIWALEDPKQFDAALENHLRGKCANGQGLEALTQPERVFYLTSRLKEWAELGDFASILFAREGAWAGELPVAFHQMEAPKTAQLCQSLLEPFGGSLPRETQARYAAIDTKAGQALDEYLDNLDVAYRQTGENLEQLGMAYAKKHRAYFT